MDNTGEGSQGEGWYADANVVVTGRGSYAENLPADSLLVGNGSNSGYSPDSGGTRTNSLKILRLLLIMKF